MDAAQEPKLAEVAERSKQAGDIRARWAWVEPAVWTDRMLAALEQGVKGGVWFSLIDKVTSTRALVSAWEQVRSNRGSGGVDHETVQQFSQHAEARLSKLSEQLDSGTYTPLPVRRVYIPKPDGKERPLGIPTIRDRIVQGALRNALEPIFEREFSEHSYGFRPGRGTKDALRRVDRQLKDGCQATIILRLSDNYSSRSSSSSQNTVVVDFFLFASFSFFVKSCEFL
jgi:RNA-directed DNA polymerase